VGRALERLPPAHARVLELWGCGTPDDEVAEELGVSGDAVPALVGIALAKLAGIVRAAVTSPQGVEP